jgi:hypothetical protein
LQTQQVGILLNDLRKKIDLSPVSFLKKHYEFKKIKERQHEPLFKIIIGCAFAEISVFSGIKNEILEENKKDILKMILNFYTDLSIEEIYKAFELERYGTYEDRTEHFQLFNAEYVSKVLKKYKNWKQNTKIQHNISASSVGNPKTEQTPVLDQKTIMDSAIKRHYQEFLKNKEVSIPCSYIFDEIYERRLFDEKTDYPIYLKIAKREIAAELKSKPVVNKKESNDIKEVLDSIENNNQNEKVLAYAKKLVLEDYFTHLRDSGIDIEDVLN